MTPGAPWTPSSRRSSSSRRSLCLVRGGKLFQFGGLHGSSPPPPPPPAPPLPPPPPLVPPLPRLGVRAARHSLRLLVSRSADGGCARGARPRAAAARPRVCLSATSADVHLISPCVSVDRGRLSCPSALPLSLACGGIVVRLRVSSSVSFVSCSCVGWPRACLSATGPSARLIVLCLSVGRG